MSEQFKEVLDKYKFPIIFSFVGVILIIGGIFSSNLNPSNSKYKSASQLTKLAATKSLNPVAKNSELKVDISGAISNPGVHILPPDARIEDAIKSAGGFSASASANYISKSLNLSQKLSDGQKIYIPFEGESGPVQSGGGEVAGAQTNIIGINSGSESQLDSLPGIGPVTAKKIISNRPYQTLDDLVTKKAVGKALFEKIKDLINLN